MKVTYRREMKHNYLIIDPEELNWSGYECQMLQKNPVEGLLEFAVRPNEEGVRFYYEITSKQPIIRLLQTRKIKAEEIRTLIIGIFSVLERMEGYLLQERRILLDPEFLYIDPDSFRIGLCLIPGLERNFAEDFSRLLEQILESIDHQDKESVVLAYGLYQETRKENYGVTDIMNFLSRACRGETSKSREEREDPEEEQQMYAGLGKVRKNAATQQENALPGDFPIQKDFTVQKRGASQKNPEIQNGDASWKNSTAYHETAGQKKEGQKGNAKRERRKTKRQTYLWERVKNWFACKFHFARDTDPVRVPWEMMFQNEETDSTFFGESPPEMPQAENDPIEQGTVLLNDFSSDNGCRILRALDAGEEDILISYYPFVIGKQEHLADYCLNKDTVSRLHVKIDRDGEHYQIQDLNSTNGTMLNGKWMDNNETNELKVGDEISIARFRFRFE